MGFRGLGLQRLRRLDAKKKFRDFRAYRGLRYIQGSTGLGFREACHNTGAPCRRRYKQVKFLYSGVLRKKICSVYQRGLCTNPFWECAHSRDSIALGFRSFSSIPFGRNRTSQRLPVLLQNP